jgi:hypothetical protein
LNSAFVENVEAVEAAGRRRALALLGAAELLGMSLWFSASAAVPALRAEWHLSESAADLFSCSDTPEGSHRQA